ncbi:MAG: bacterial transcriptional activator domain-containing protein, partial [Gemmatimonadales bacterium]
MHFARRHLDEGAIRTRGDDEVSLDPDMVHTDVAAMLDDIAEGRNAGAGERYAGELLPGLHIDQAEGFEKWLGQERSRLNGLARKAAMQLAESREKASDLPGAIEAARRASELDPDDEAAAQRWIALLDRSGDRSQAFAVYERFRKHVADEFGSRPSAETIALVDAVRTRRSAIAPALIEMPPKIDAAPVIETPAVDYEPAQLTEAKSMIAVPLAMPADSAILEGHLVPEFRSRWLWVASA